LWAVVGLGNPGRKYSRTRHNAGFMVVEALAEKHGREFSQGQLCLLATASPLGVEAVLAEPLTFMNRSGAAVREVLKRFHVPPEWLIVIHDDLDMETGRLKVKRGGSSGGHKGVDSIIREVGSSAFIRVKIGIGKPGDAPAEEYVLRKFTRPEITPVKRAVALAVEAVETILAEGVEQAMNRYNRKPVSS